MWIFRIILVLLVALLALYYGTVVVHVVTPIFNKKANQSLFWIPFYAWIKGL